MAGNRKKLTPSDLRCWPCNMVYDEVCARLCGFAMPNAPVPPARGLHLTGLEPMIKAVVDIIRLPIQFPHVYVNSPFQRTRGVLLHGPPGNGKTQLANAIVEESYYPPKFACFWVVGHAILAGDADANLRHLMEAARALAPSFIFYDEADCLITQRTEQSTALYTFLATLDGITCAEHVVSMAATNQGRYVDSAVTRPGRLELVLELRNPIVKDRRACLTAITARWQLPVALIYAVAAKTTGYSRAGLASLCSKAGHFALMRKNPQLADHNPRNWGGHCDDNVNVTEADFDAAIDAMQNP